MFFVLLIQLCAISSIFSEIHYLNRTIQLPCGNETSAKELIQQVLQRLNIPREDEQDFELMALDDDQTPIESDMTIEDIYQLFSSKSTVIPFQLIKRNK